MASFKRHQQHKDVPYTEGCGGLMWDAWGGTSGIEWAERKLKEIDKEKSIKLQINKTNLDTPNLSHIILFARISHMRRHEPIFGKYLFIC